MYKQSLSLLTLCAICIAIQAQVPKIPPVKIGDKIPDTKVEYLENGVLKTANLSDLRKGKLVILDFWATWCSPCVDGLRIFDSLNRKIGDKAVILPVAYEQQAKVTRSLDRLFKGNRPVTTIVNDSLLSKFFPHRVLPHDVWIDSDGVVKAITDSDDITEKNIRSMLAGPLSLETKADQMDFDFHKPYKVDNSQIQYRSILTGYNPHIFGGDFIEPLGIDPEMKRKRVFYSENNMAELIYKAFYKDFPWSGTNMKRIELRTTDSTRFFWPDSVMSAAYQAKYATLRDWKKRNLYCYELMLPEAIESEAFWKLVFDELCKTLPVNVSIQKKRRPCWRLVVKNRHLLQKGTGKPGIVWGNWGYLLAKLQNHKIDLLVHYLNGLKDIDPVVNETKINYPLNLTVNLPKELGQTSFDFDQIRKDLNANGLDLVRGVRPVDIIVIEDKK